MPPIWKSDVVCQMDDGTSRRTRNAARFRLPLVDPCGDLAAAADSVPGFAEKGQEKITVGFERKNGNELATDLTFER